MIHCKLSLTRQMLSVVILVWACWGQTQAAVIDHDGPVLVQLPGTTIGRGEFELSYRDWRDRYPAAQLTSREFLNLLIRLKQLAMVARAMELHRKPEFGSALAGYIAEARDIGLLRRDIENWKLREAYVRQQYVINASQILISPSAEVGDPRADLARKIERIRNRLLTEKTPFAAIARTESDDPSAKENGGSLGYFSVFDQLYPLETAAYDTPVGGISEPVKTRFGYHFVRVDSRHRIRGLKRASHILIKHETRDAQSRIEGIWRRLSADNFTALATAHSQDYKTSVKGGDLGTDRLIDALETVRLSLATGATSAPFPSPLGWHILKVTALEPFPAFEQSRPTLRAKLILDDRVQRELDRIIDADDPTELDSAVLPVYLDDLLCRMLLARDGARSKLQFGSRSRLIKRLMSLQLPPALLQQINRFPAKIDRGALQLVDA